MTRTLVVIVIVGVCWAELQGHPRPHAGALSRYDRSGAQSLDGQRENIEKVSTENFRQKRFSRCGRSGKAKYESWFSRGCPPGWGCWRNICVMRRIHY